MQAEREERSRLVSVQELADFLGVKPSWVYGKTSAGEIPHVKVGHYVRFHVPTILRWLESGKGGERHGE